MSLYKLIFFVSKNKGFQTEIVLGVLDLLSLVHVVFSLVPLEVILDSRGFLYFQTSRSHSPFDFSYLNLNLNDQKTHICLSFGASPRGVGCTTDSSSRREGVSDSLHSTP